MSLSDTPYSLDGVMRAAGTSVSAMISAAERFIASDPGNPAETMNREDLETYARSLGGK